MSKDKLAVIGPASWNLFTPHLARALATYGLDYTVEAYGFDREPGLWTGSDEAFERDPPRGAIVLPQSRTLFREFLDDPRTAAQPAERARDAAQLLCGAIASTAARHPKVAWVVCTADGMYPGAGDSCADPATDAFTVAVDEFNRLLCEFVRQRPGWSIFDRRRLTARWGTHVLEDPRLDLLGRFPASARGMPLLAERLAAHWAAVCGKMKKVLVLDCDNTLWGGVVGEDGIDGIQIGDDGAGRAYAEFQKALLALEQRGAVLTLCSRNEPADVDEVFARRREMVLSLDRIAAVEVGWGAKSDGLRRLSARLALGLSDFVFVDDNPAEREQVRQALPEVTVPEFPADPADLPGFGYELGWRYFYRVSLSDEDRAKTEQYRTRADFAQAAEGAASPQQFLQSLGMKALLAVDSEGLLARCTQLTQKTNQFNLTLVRYTEAEMRDALADPRSRVIAGSLEDRFGKHGWIALAILRREAPDTAWLLDTFLMSCRVLGRSFEQAFARACIDRVRAESDLPVRARFVPGKRNAQVRDLCESLGFRLISEASDGSKEYELERGTPVVAPHPFVEILWEQ